MRCSEKQLFQMIVYDPYMNIQSKKKEREGIERHLSKREIENE